MSSLVYCSDHASGLVTTRAGRGAMSGMDMAHAMFEQNFGTLRDLQEEHRVLSLRYAEATTALRIKEENLEKIETALKAERELLITRLEAHAASIQKSEQEHNTEMKQVQEQHKQEVVALHRAHTRNLFATFVTTAAGAVGITWALHKLKIL